MLDAYRDLIDDLLETPSEIRGLVGAEGQGDPSAEARSLIAELRDRDRVVLERVQAMTRRDTPYLRTLTTGAGAVDAELPSLLDEMDVARGDLVSLLMNLSIKDWERDAIDETEGQWTLADEVERHVEFDEAHRRQLRELMSAS